LEVISEIRWWDEAAAVVRPLPRTRGGRPEPGRLCIGYPTTVVASEEEGCDEGIPA
jgi:hypothetical protein